jgi:tetratricopeptide (TPR) repeat protein
VSAATRSRLGRFLGGTALVALTVLAYLPALGAGFIWDDDLHVTQNEALRTWHGLADIWFKPGTILQYYPLTHTAWWVQYHLWSLAPVGYHLVNVLLHAGSVVVLWLVLGRLGVPGAWPAAAVFALHPVHVESVAWVTELKNVQSGFFYLLALLAFLRWALAGEGRRGGYALSLVLFLCAVLSKSVAGTLPAAIALVLWWKRGRLTRREIVALVPFGVVSAAAAVTTAWMEHHYVGAIGEEWALSPPERCLVAGRALWFYAAKLAWPFDLAFVYPRWALDPRAWWQWLFPLAAVAVPVVLTALGRRLGRAPLATALFFVVTLVPALGFVDVYPMRYSFVADHFQYLASIGPIVLLVAAGAAILDRMLPVARGPLSTVLLAMLGVLVWRQAGVYTTPETLWRATLARNPSAWMAHNNLGLVLQAEGRADEAAEHYREAVRLRPNYPEALYNLGNVLAAGGRLAEAEAQYEQAVGLDDGFAAAHNNLGNVLLMQGKVDQGIGHYRRALEINPKYADARENLAIAEGQRGHAPSDRGNLAADGVR